MSTFNPVYRATVVYSNSTTGQITVRIPSLAGANSTLDISYIGRAAVNNLWTVPNIGDQIVVTADDANFTNTFWVQTNPSSTPTGSVTQYAGSAAPTGWLFCDGAEVSRTTYAALFAVIGTTFGVGDGSTTFNLPDLKGRIPVGKATTGTFSALNNKGGAETHTLISSEMPSHTHTQNAHSHTEILADGVLQIGSNESAASSIRSKHDRNAADTTGAKWSTNGATATNQSTGGGAAHNNLQPYIVLNYIIKAVAF